MSDLYITINISILRKPSLFFLRTNDIAILKYIATDWLIDLCFTPNREYSSHVMAEIHYTFNWQPVDNQFNIQYHTFTTAIMIRFPSRRCGKVVVFGTTFICAYFYRTQVHLQSSVFSLNLRTCNLAKCSLMLSLSSKYVDLCPIFSDDGSWKLIYGHLLKFL